MMRTWDDTYESVKAFLDANGNLSCTSASDRKWMSRQRKHRENLTETQIEKLDAIGFDWELSAVRNDKQWDQMFNMLREYKVEYGHYRVPQQEIYRGKSLGDWVSTQMCAYRENTLRVDREDRLESIEFEWYRDERYIWSEDRHLGALKDRWEEKFQSLCEFNEEYGNTLVPTGYMARNENGEEYNLGSWVGRQRQEHREGILRAERRDKLERIAFVFAIEIDDAESSMNQRVWDDWYFELVEFKRLNGSCRVPKNDPNTELESWVAVQRSLRTKGKLLESRFKRLDALGFSWSQKMENWDYFVTRLKAFKSEHGHCRVPANFVSPDGVNLGTWVSMVRNNRMRPKKRGNTLTAEKISQLDELAFYWDSKTDQDWELMFKQLKHYKKAHGHCRVPITYKDKAKDLPAGLARWVANQRQRASSKRNDPVFEERQQRLQELGFQFTLRNSKVSENRMKKWNVMFEGLKRFKAEHGHCRVSRHYECEEALPSRLGNWVADQRQSAKMKSGKPVYVERRKLLDKIGFDWGRSGSLKPPPGPT